MSDRANLDKKPLILIVDDEQFMRVIFRDALTEAGFMTTTATDGISAISIFKDMQPDLVLLDLVMPMKDGFETCQDIRSLTEGRYTPILMVTGLDDTGLIHRAFEAGATDFISKPVKPELLVYRVRYMLRASWNVKNLAESEARLARAQEIGHLGNWEWNPFNGTFWWSDEMFRILGMEKSPELPSFESFLFAVYPPDREMVETGLKNTLKNKSTCSFECRIKRSDAELRLVSLHGRAETTVTGKALRLAGTLQDISDLRQVENRLKMLKEAVDSLPIGITLSDINGRIVYSNPAEARMHGYDVEELIGREAREFASNDLRKPFHPEKTRELGVWRRESVNIRKNGEEFPVQLMSMSVLDSESRWLGIVTTCEDISEKKEAEGKIHRLAYFDLLTGLPNRGMFLDRLQQALALAHREGDKVSLIFLDLDNFKDVNDTQGHDFGDKLLCQVAERLSACMRESDTLARLGGDEFVVVLTSVHSHACVAAAAQRILSVFSQPFEIDGRQIYSSASLGIALYPDDCKDASSLFRCADTAMYNAKNEGRSQFRFFSKEMNQKITRRVALENSLRRGLEKKEFFLLYQPQWDLKTSRMVGVEVLLRWQSEDFGLMPPSEFISLTEDSGLIFSIGEWVLRSACIQAKRWAMAGHQDFKVAVNISGKQLKQPDFLAMLKSIIQETGVDPGGIELEFTESVIMENAGNNIETLNALKEMGIQLSIDDFGTGYSSLNYLKHFPVDRIKIDRSFVADVNRSNGDASIVDAIISMAQRLSLKVVAEGVENSDQLYYLTTLGCDEVQGFYLAMPMHAEALAENLGGVHGKEVGKLPVIEWFDNRPGLIPYDFGTDSATGITDLSENAFDK